MVVALGPGPVLSAAEGAAGPASGRAHTFCCRLAPEPLRAQAVYAIMSTKVNELCTSGKAPADDAWLLDWSDREVTMGLQAIRVRDLVETRLYDSEDEVVRDALRHLLLDRPDLRILVAVHRYRTDPELSLARAAAIAGVSLERMKEILDRHSVPLRLGPATVAEARAEAATLEGWFDAGSG